VESSNKDGSSLAAGGVEQQNEATGGNGSDASSSSNSRRRKIAGIGSASEPSPDSTSSVESSTKDGSSLAAGGVEQQNEATTSASSSAPGTQQQQQQQQQQQPQSNSQPSRVSSIPPTAPLLHPQPQLASLHLHEFFSQYRPLLLLGQPLPSLFTCSELSPHFPNPPGATDDTPESILDDAAVARAIGIDVGGHEHPSEAEADADVARMLARSLVVQRIQANRDWGRVLTRLGLEHGMDEEEAVREAVFNLDSVKRKRRKKMNKHKYQKRRKVQRAERRRMGK